MYNLTCNVWLTVNVLKYVISTNNIPAVATITSIILLLVKWLLLVIGSEPETLTPL